ncbi:sterol desaturase family protein [Leptospira selangorensis]|uniref:Sterol desaturase family protein n=1 Tax=Leptospira selangorensis TaxID=2484982 RepID=A0A5F2BVY6_9LEPT|nr:sterol desaturase family protein [Leptospira selangorensis]TGM12064.1 sterol desaturase family protein [Leptospira selangorensis]TGM15075.1 sterol desaturase family protein [Leptospira selangorensis]
MQSYFTEIFRSLLSPIRIIFLPSVKIYWFYILSSILITLLLIIWRSWKEEGFRSKDYLRENLSKKIWLHKSALLDYKYYLINTFLFALFFSYFVISGAGVSAFISGLLFKIFGEANHLSSVGTFFILIYSILFWLANDFGRFFAHWLLHKTFLWEFHKLHHSAKVLNPLTVYRVHPVEAILVNSLGALCSGIVTGIAVFLFPNGINMLSFLGVNAGIFVFNLYANLRHSHIGLRFPIWLSKIFLSPAQHQIHHSIDINLQNKNIGVSFAFWDILFGSLYIPQEGEAEQTIFGLEEEEDANFENIFKIYFLPFQKILSKTRTLITLSKHESKS